jgi:hypothetical protein
MKKPKKPTFSDYPIDECVEMASQIVADGNKIHQKWTCSHCGSRQTMGEPNQFFRAGKCESCGETTIITKCNYMVIGNFNTLGKHLFK